MLRFISLICFCGGCLHGAQLDPQINVMNVGSVIDVAPHVSSDRKYITVGVGGGSSNLVRLNRAEIITLDVLGLPLFSAKPAEILQGKWSATDPLGNEKESSRDWSINIRNDKVTGHCADTINGMSIKEWKWDKNIVMLQIAHADSSQKRRSATTGAERPPKMTYTYIKGVFSEDMHSIQGKVIVGNQKKDIELKRTAPKLAKAAVGQWGCDISIAHKSYRDTRSKKFSLNMTEQGVAAAWPAVWDMQLSVLRYDQTTRQLVMLVTYKKSERSRKRSRGYINGKFDATFTQFDACFETGDYGQAHIQMRREK